MSSSSLESALVRLLIDTQNPRKPVGAGFFVTPNHVITCAHVLNDALRRPQSSPDRPDTEIFLDFSLVKDQPLLRARVLHWYPVLEDSAVGELEDIAVLELLSETSLPAGLRPAPVVVAAEQEGFFTESKVRMCGFPVGVDHGTYANGILQGRTAKGWVEIHHRGDNLVEQGFSGTAVWAVGENAVCGMTVSVLNRRNAVVAYMIPASVLIAAFPEMEKLSRPANPYRGLEAFREKDAKLYFGREQTITRLQQVIADQPFAAVIGASGSGKSSVVFAGLVPALRQSGDWLIAHCRPKNQPLYELAACLIPLLYDDPLMRSEKNEALDKKFSTGSITLTSLIRQICEKYEGQYFLLIVDQFEELFTLNPDTKLIRQYIDLLLECLHTEHFTVLCTMRADFFAAAVSHPALAQALDSYAPIILPQLDEQGLREAVEQPASSLGVRFADGLVDLIIRDVGQEPGSLPLLEFCLTQLWERQEFRQIKHDAYTAIGGVQQALANHADAVYAEFTESERERLRHIFLRLVRPGQGTEDTRQVANLEQIRVEDRTLITRLADKRLIVTGRDEERGEETVEVVHEALIRRWRTLRQWVDEEREFLVWQEKLRVLLGQWQESGRDEGALLRGLPLDEALKWRGSHAFFWTDEERDFIEESEAARKKQRRRKGIVVATGILLAMAVMMTFFVLWKDAERQKKIAEQERHHAVEQSEIAKKKTIAAEKEKDKAEQHALKANYNFAKLLEGKALTSLKEANGRGDQEYKKTILFASAALEQQVPVKKSALKASVTGEIFVSQVFNAVFAERAVLKGHEAIVISAVFSPNGKTIVSASSDKTVRIWNVKSGKQLTILRGHESDVNSAVFSSDGKTIVSASGDKTVRIWDAVSGKELMVLKGHDASVTSAVFSSDGKTIASASHDKTVRIWDVKNGKQLAVLTGHEAPVFSAVFSPNGKKIVSASIDRTVRTWDVKSSKQLAILTGKGRDFVLNEHANFFDAAFSPDGKAIVSAYDEIVRIWDTVSGKELMALKGHKAPVLSAVFSPDGKTIVSACSDNSVWIWDVKSGKQLAILKGHEAAVLSATFSPDGKTIVSASYDKTVRIWDVESNRGVMLLKGYNFPFNSAHVSSDGKTISSASGGNSLWIWDAASGRNIKILLGHYAPASSVVLSPDGKTIVSAFGKIFSVDRWTFNDTIYDYTSYGKRLRIWDATSGRDLISLTGHEDTVLSATFSPSGKTIVSASSDKTVRIWDAVSGKELMVLKGHEDTVYSATFSPDGKTIASASSDKTVRIWDAVSGKELMVLKGHDASVTSATFSSAGKTIASASHDKTVRIWDAASGKKLMVLKGHEDTVYSATFSSDGKTIASASRDKTVRIWDAVSGRELAILKGHQDTVNSVVFNPDDHKIISASRDKTVRIWNVRLLLLFLHNSKPTPLYHTFIDAVKFLWQLDVQGLEVVETERRTPADLKKYGTLLNPPPPGQSKFDQVLEWAQQQQEK